MQPGSSTTALRVCASVYLFTGKERDTESGLDYFGARYYGSSMGRFMSPDWSATVEPVPYARLDDPQSLNLYSYVGNNPLSDVDSAGGPLKRLLLEWGTGVICLECHPDFSGSTTRDRRISSHFPTGIVTRILPIPRRGPCSKPLLNESAAPFSYASMDMLSCPTMCICC